MNKITKFHENGVSDAENNLVKALPWYTTRILENTNVKSLSKNYKTNKNYNTLNDIMFKRVPNTSNGFSLKS